MKLLLPPTYRYVAWSCRSDGDGGIMTGINATAKRIEIDLDLPVCVDLNVIGVSIYTQIPAGQLLDDHVRRTEWYFEKTVFVRPATGRETSIAIKKAAVVGYCTEVDPADLIDASSMKKLADMAASEREGSAYILDKDMKPIRFCGVRFSENITVPLPLFMRRVSSTIPPSVGFYENALRIVLLRLGKRDLTNSDYDLGVVMGLVCTLSSSSTTYQPDGLVYGSPDEKFTALQPFACGDCEDTSLRTVSIFMGLRLMERSGISDELLQLVEYAQLWEPAMIAVKSTSPRASIDNTDEMIGTHAVVVLYSRKKTHGLLLEGTGCVCPIPLEIPGMPESAVSEESAIQLTRKFDHDLLDAQKYATSGPATPKLLWFYTRITSMVTFSNHYILRNTPYLSEFLKNTQRAMESCTSIVSLQTDDKLCRIFDDLLWEPIQSLTQPTTIDLPPETDDWFIPGAPTEYYTQICRFPLNYIRHHKPETPFLVERVWVEAVSPGCTWIGAAVRLPRRSYSRESAPEPRDPSLSSLIRRQGHVKMLPVGGRCRWPITQSPMGEPRSE